MTNSKDQFIEAAIRVFAARGFYGTSIAAIVADLPYTKQALLHHFGSKEKLYGEVLRHISERLVRELQAAMSEATDPRANLEITLVAFYRSALTYRDETILLMRELLDNEPRAAQSKSWYLRGFLEGLSTAVAQANPTRFPDPQAAMPLTYQLLGAIQYFVVSEPTLRQLLGADAYAAMRGRYEHDLRLLIARSVDHPSDRRETAAR